MPFFYIVPCIGDGLTRATAFRPHGHDRPGATWIDLRPDPTQVNGRYLLCLPQADPALRAGLISSARAERFGAASRQRFRELTGVQDNEADDVPGLARAILFRPSRRPGLCRPAGWSQRGEREVWLNNERIAFEAGGPTDDTDIDPSDSGAGADANPIGGNWTTAPSLNAIRRTSNTFATNSTSADCVAYWSASAAPNDQFSEVAYATAADGDAGPAARVSTVAQTLYFITAAFGCFNFLAGAFNQVSAATVTPANGNTVRLTCTGSTIAGSFNGAADYFSVTDTAIATGRWGMFIFNDAIRLNNWLGGPDVAGTPYNRWAQLAPILAQ